MSFGTNCHFMPGREARRRRGRAAPTPSPVDDRLGRHRQGLAHGLVAAVLEIEVEREGAGLPDVARSGRARTGPWRLYLGICSPNGAARARPPARGGSRTAPRGRACAGPRGTAARPPGPDGETRGELDLDQGGPPAHRTRRDRPDQRQPEHPRRRRRGRPHGAARGQGRGRDGLHAGGERRRAARWVGCGWTSSPRSPPTTAGASRAPRMPGRVTAASPPSGSGTDDHHGHRVRTTLSIRAVHRLVGTRRHGRRAGPAAHPSPRAPAPAGAAPRPLRGPAAVAGRRHRADRRHRPGGLRRQPRSPSPATGWRSSAPGCWRPRAAASSGSASGRS